MFLILSRRVKAMLFCDHTILVGWRYDSVFPVACTNMSVSPHDVHDFANLHCIMCPCTKAKND